MPVVIGVVLALALLAFARVVGFDRERAFYPTVAIVVASYYVLFAALGGSTRDVLVEAAVMLVFVAASVVGFKRSVWIVVAALAGHAVFDAVRSAWPTGGGVPEQWPAFCGAFDLVASAGVAWGVLRGRVVDSGVRSRP